MRTSRAYRQGERRHGSEPGASASFPAPVTIGAGNGRQGTVIDTSDERRARAHRRAVVLGMAIYGVLLLVVVLWPTPVDSGSPARAVVRWLTTMVPLLTYERLEFLSNVVMFVPVGAGLAALVRCRWAVVPLSLLFAASVEAAQALLLPARTPSILDVLANTIGAAVGLAAVVARGRMAARRT